MNIGLDYYGVWNVGSDWTWDLDDTRRNNTPHLKVYWRGRRCNAAINVASSDMFISRLVHWEDENFPKDHEIIPALEGLKVGYHEAPPDSPLRLDLLRGGVITTRGNIWEQTMEGDDNDLVDKIIKILKKADSNNATLYLFGEPYKRGDGIHQIHQNQGNFYFPNQGRTIQFFYENGVGQDGGIFFRFPDGTWTTIFLAFASQAVHTDDESGIPLGTFQGQDVLNYQDTIDWTGVRTTPESVIHPP